MTSIAADHQQTLNPPESQGNDEDQRALATVFRLFAERGRQFRTQNAALVVPGKQRVNPESVSAAHVELRYVVSRGNDEGFADSPSDNPAQ